MPKETNENVEKRSTKELLEEIQLRRLQKEEAAEEEAVRLAEASRRANFESIKLGRANELANQAACPHQKQNGEPSIAGQRLHSHKHQWICLFCQKEWLGAELPLHLRINAELVGGPNF